MSEYKFNIVIKIDAEIETEAPTLKEAERKAELIGYREVDDYGTVLNERTDIVE